jgi:hypothetical protein
LLYVVAVLEAISMTDSTSFHQKVVGETMLLTLLTAQYGPQVSLNEEVQQQTQWVVWAEKKKLEPEKKPS